MKFILSDERINRYGFRVLTSGIDIEDFKKNPVMFYNHQRSGSYDTQVLLPIGKWENIAFEGDKLVADAVFDENDPLAQQVKQKVEKGILNAASLGFNVLAVSEESEYMLPGQVRPTVTKCTVFEASIVDIPGNAGALKMNFIGKGITLSGNFPDEYLNSVLPPVKHNLKTGRIPLMLGLRANATENEILAALTAIDQQAKYQECLLNSFLEEAERQGVEHLNKDTVRRLAKVDFSGACSLVGDMIESKKTHKSKAVPKHESIANAIRQLSLYGNVRNVAEDQKSWTLDDWRKKDQEGLERMRITDPTRFASLIEAISLKN